MRRQLDFLLKLGPALVVDARPAKRRGRGGLSPRQPKSASDWATARRRIKAKWGLWLNANLRRKTALARDRASELVTLAQHSGDGDLLLEAYHCRWSTAFFRGDVAADAGRWPHRHRDSTTWPGIATSATRSAATIPAFARMSQCGNALQLSGDRDKRRAHSFAQALALAEMLDHPNSLAHALHNGGIGHQLGGDREAVSGGGASRGGAGGKIRPDAMARRQLGAGGLGHRDRLRRRRRRAADRCRDRQCGRRRPAAAILSGLGGGGLAGRRAGRRRPRPSRPRHRRRSTSPASDFICRKSIACAANACWRSTATTRTRRGGLSRPRATSPAAGRGHLRAPRRSGVGGND